MKIFVIGDRETCLAFALAGIRGQAPQRADEVPAILAALSREEAALILIDETLAEKNRDTVERILLEPGGPLIVEIPGFSGPVRKRAKATERLMSLLRR